MINTDDNRQFNSNNDSQPNTSKTGGAFVSARLLNSP